MSIRYTDSEISALVRERKPLPKNWRSKIELRHKVGHKERELDISGAEGKNFRVLFRQSDFNPFDFSIILVVLPPDTSQDFRLRRYNGNSHEHTNKIEKNRFYDFHIHQATERYQELGMREDSFAEPTDRFVDFDSAVKCLLEDCNFADQQGPLLTMIEESDQ